MHYLVYAFSALNIYLGAWFFLNAIGVLQSSKYSHKTNICFALLLSASAGLAVYYAIAKGQNSLALLIDGGPWIFTLVLIVGSLLFGNTK